MSSRPHFALGLAATVLATAAPALAESSLVRIEPRPYYGAVVTMEQGVRVWRPLPPTRQMIINPGNATPLNLNITDVRETRTSTNVWKSEGGSAPAAAGGYGPAAYGPAYYGAGHRAHPGHRTVRRNDGTRGIPARGPAR